MHHIELLSHVKRVETTSNDMAIHGVTKKEIVIFVLDVGGGGGYLATYLGR